MREPLWTAAEIVAATGGSPHGDFAATGVSIDTRSLEPGDLFVALAGVRDGHEFLPTAFDRGAAGALVSQAVDRPSVRTADTLVALEQLGRAARDRAANARRAAVTGSVGKTSVTQAIAAGLRLAGPAHHSVKSYNNHIGVPLTLARMPRDTARAVFEIGMNHAGEIGPLSRQVAPHVAVITVVGPVHVENFPDGEVGVAHAKAEIFDGMEPGALAILNADNPWFDLLAGAARARGLRIATFGAAAQADARVLGLVPLRAPGDGPAGQVVHARVHGEDIQFPIAQSGAHWGPNSLASLLALDALDVPRDVALSALAQFAPLEGRGAARRLAAPGGEIVLIDESYNANPLSMAAALASLGARPATGRRIVVVTDMLELGDAAPAAHAGLAGPIEDAGVDLVFAAGPLMRSLWEALPESRRGAYAGTAAELAPHVCAAVRAGDVVMVKGSNGSKASLVVRALVDTAPSAAREEGR